MFKNKKQSPIGEDYLHIPPHPFYSAPTRSESPVAFTPIVDTHTHLVSTYQAYLATYPEPRYTSIYDFVRGFYAGVRPTESTEGAQRSGSNVEAIVDVWCEAPVVRAWKELADSALREEDRKTLWGGIEYWFVMGVHPHNAKRYTDAIENEIIQAMSHPRCVGWGEMGLDYHYSNSPRDVQQEVFARQLRCAVKLGKPLTIHTREAEEDTERLLLREVPKDHKIHIHCFTDSPEWANRMLRHFPNLYIGITGVITYASNLNTSAVVRQMTLPLQSDPSLGATLDPTHLRILLETDAPYMTPSNLKVPSSTANTSLPTPARVNSEGPDPKGSKPARDNGKNGNKNENKNKRFPLSHPGMIPWTAEFVARVASGVPSEPEVATTTSPVAEGKRPGGMWDVEEVMRVARDNARRVYGV